MGGVAWKLKASLSSLHYTLVRSTSSRPRSALAPAGPGRRGVWARALITGPAVGQVFAVWCAKKQVTDFSPSIHTLRERRDVSDLILTIYMHICTLTHNPPVATQICIGGYTSSFLCESPPCGLSLLACGRRKKEMTVVIAFLALLFTILNSHIYTRYVEYTVCRPASYSDSLGWPTFQIRALLQLQCCRACVSDGH